MSRLRRIEKSRFLGKEFLLWLWFRSEQMGGTYELDEHGEVEIFIDDRIVLEPIYGDGNKNALSGVTPATSPEASIALQFNKVPSEMKVKCIKDARGWGFSIKGEDLQLRSLKMPEVLSQEEDEQLYERLYLMEEIESIFEDVLAYFLKIRLEDDWDDEVEAIKTWILEKSQEIQMVMPNT